MTDEQEPESFQDERRRRWRLILGEAGGNSEQRGSLSESDAAMDRALDQLYDQEREGSLSDSNPDIARWLGDIRTYFPQSVVRVMQQDALDRIGLRRLLLEPEFLDQIEPDVQLVANLLALNKIMPSQTRETARQVVRKVVDELLKKLANPLRQAVHGSLNRAQRNRRPRLREINWDRTIRANLKNYQPDLRSVVPEELIGYGRRRSSLHDIILCVDQSGSMAASVVYASIFGAVLASLPAVSTHMIVFDTAVVDLTEKLADPVDLLFGAKLGGGTDINRALGYCTRLITRPQDTLLVLITDLFEGGRRDQMLQRVEELTAAGVQVVCLLALNDRGAPSFNRDIAQALVERGVVSFACTPELFPDLMAAALNRQDITRWAARHDIVTAPQN